MKLRRTLLVALAVLAVVVPLVAASGGAAGAATEISTCAQVVTTNAFLATDLFCPGQSGVVVGASGITIDLNGHMLRGNGTTGHFGIDDIGGFDRVTIENGDLRNFDEGLAAMNADRIRLSNLFASGNLDDGFRVFGDLASVDSSTVAENRLEGIHISGISARIRASTAVGNLEAGIEIGGDSAKIQGSTASGNGNVGIFVDGDEPVLAANRADGNGFADGVSDLIGQGIVVAGFRTAPKGMNVARGNDSPMDCDPSALCGAAPKAKPRKGTPVATCAQVVTTDAFLTGDLTCPGKSGIVVGAPGITIDLNGHTLRGDRSTGTFGIDDDAGFAGVTIRNGTVRNFFDGVHTSNGANSVKIFDLVASATTESGIGVNGASASVSASTATGNADGMVLVGDSARIQGSTASGNAESGVSADGDSDAIKASTVFGNGTFGIAVGGDSVSIQASTFSGNGFEGIFVGGEGSVIKGDRAEANGFAGAESDLVRLGIVVTGFTTFPKGTNVARGNDDPAQCMPSTLC